jgi:hypothetical protein
MGRTAAGLLPQDARQREAPRSADIAMAAPFGARGKWCDRARKSRGCETVVLGYFHS